MAPPVDWRLHLSSAPEAVFERWATDKGRASFWAERSGAAPGGFELRFINGQILRVEVVEAVAGERFVFHYFGGSTVSVSLAPDGRGGCDLRLVEEGAPEPEENRAGWVSVLLALKAAADFGIDLRSHDPARNWDEGFVDV